MSQGKYCFLVEKPISYEKPTYLDLGRDCTYHGRFGLVIQVPLLAALDRSWLGTLEDKSPKLF